MTLPHHHSGENWQGCQRKSGEISGCQHSVPAPGSNIATPRPCASTPRTSSADWERYLDRGYKADPEGSVIPCCGGRRNGEYNPPYFVLGIRDNSQPNLEAKRN